MPIRVATGKIILSRDGKRVVVRAGESFDFTAEELANLRDINPNAVRKPRVEAPAAVQASVETALEKNAAELGELAAGVQETDESTDQSSDSPAGGEAPAAASGRGNNRGGRGRGRNAAAAESADDDEL